MEELDAVVCAKVVEALHERYRPRVTVASSRDLTPYEMVPLLRRLNYLVTSRYHACVLSMANAVPQMAVCHDDRLRAVYNEMGMGEFLLEHSAAGLDRALAARFDALVARGAELSDRLRHAYTERYVPKCHENRRVLHAWATSRLAGWLDVPTATGADPVLESPHV
jgi:polysaccharide pyruvyl transferase WcaK-like protein